MLLCREHRRLHLIEVGQRLKDDEIGARRLPRRDHLAEQLIGVLKGERTQRLDQLPDGADVERNAHARDAGVLRRSPRDRHIRPDDLGDRFPRADELVPVRTERIAVNDAAARRDIVSMHLFDDLGMLHAKELGTLSGRKSARLKLRAHASVEYDDVLHSYISHFIFMLMLPPSLRPLCICAPLCGTGSCGT